MTEEIRATGPPVAAATEVEKSTIEKVGSNPPEQAIETQSAPVPDQLAEPGAVKADEKTDAPAATEPAIPELVNAQWGPVSPPLAAIYRKLPEIFERGGAYKEVFGITLVYEKDSTSPDFGTLLILQKFLRANSNNIEKAVEQLASTLRWRQEKKPLESMAIEYNREAFEGLGYVQVINSTGEVLTWNIYGAVKSYKKTFGDLEQFLNWRVALMEAAIAKLNLTSATKPIPDFGKGEDPYQIAQIHDYLNVSFLRQDPDVKAASKAAPALFSSYYPEMLSRKFFVNVPVIMGWLYKAITLVLPATTVKKFKVMSYGKDLQSELGDEIPEVYGGKGVKDLKDLGEPLKLTEAAAPVVTTAPESVAVPDAPTAPTA
ncbi:Patellin-4 [Arthrobotrys entomopaga]|nr:Patellin-4 [Arthrobotrys entomopaga]